MSSLDKQEVKVKTISSKRVFQVGGGGMQMGQQPLTVSGGEGGDTGKSTEPPGKGLQNQCNKL